MRPELDKSYTFKTDRLYWISSRFAEPPKRPKHLQAKPALWSAQLPSPPRHKKFRQLVPILLSVNKKNVGYQLATHEALNRHTRANTSCTHVQRQATKRRQ